MVVDLVVWWSGGLGCGFVVGDAYPPLVTVTFLSAAVTDFGFGIVGLWCGWSRRCLRR